MTGPIAAALAAAWLSAPAAAADLASGLVATYTRGSERVVTVEPLAAFTLGPEDSAHPQVGPGFAAAYRGVLRVVRPGTYRILAAGTGMAEVTLDGRPAGEAATLEAGDHRLEIGFTRMPGPARLQLRWSSEHFVEEPVPASVLFHRPDAEAAAQAVVDRGRELVEAYHCTACHAPSTAAVVAGGGGPNLSAVGSRTSAAWIARWLAGPREMKAGARMPLVPLSDGERADLAAFLSSLAGRGMEEAEIPTDRFRVKRGAALMSSLGCAACHGENGVPLAGLGSKYTTAALKAFLEAPLSSRPSGLMPDLMLNGEEASLLAEFLTAGATAEEFDAPPPGDAGRGKRLFRERGCAACHDAGAGRAPPRAGPLAGLKPGGCLASDPPAPLPRYGLDAGEREAIGAYLAAADVAPAPVHEFRRRAKAMKCTACHELDGSPKPDLAELPPPLTGAGTKLRRSRVHAVLVERARARPWLGLRMPHFGPAVESMVDGLAAASGAESGEGEPTAPPSADRIREGTALIGKGEGTLACVRCHDYPGYAAPGEHGPDLTILHDSVRPEWFRRWMRAPLRLRPNTRMPTFFAGKPAAEADATIALLWDALSAGSDMPPPPGTAGKDRVTVEVADRPVVIRTFMPDSGWRSLAVGLPGYLAYCFDAQECRLKYAWTWLGPFLDVEGPWTGRGGQEAEPLGDRFYVAGEPYPLGVGGGRGEPEVEFLGYELDGSTVAVRYKVNGAAVEERVRPLKGGRGLMREFTVSARGRAVRFVPGRLPPGVTCGSVDGEWRDGALEVEPGDPTVFTVTINVAVPGREPR